jgi:hypothetical protein
MSQGHTNKPYKVIKLFLQNEQIGSYRVICNKRNFPYCFIDKQLGDIKLNSSGKGNIPYPGTMLDYTILNLELA